MATDIDNEYEYDQWDEVIGSCDRCGCNLYADDMDDFYCDQCLWWIEQCSE